MLITDDKNNWKTIDENEWLELRSTDYDNIKDYIYAHSKKANGNVAILPIRNDENKPFLGSFEVVPCHFDGKQLVSITGMIDNGDTLEQTCIKEIKEECHYHYKFNEFQFLGKINPSKCTDQEYYLFAINVTDKERHEKISDDASGEKNSYCEWVALEECIMSKDPILCSLVMRFDMFLTSLPDDEQKNVSNIIIP